MVALPYFSHSPAAVQRPFSPQLSAACVMQRWLQHTFWTQAPDAHSPSPAQAVPLPFLAVSPPSPGGPPPAPLAPPPPFAPPAPPPPSRVSPPAPPLPPSRAPNAGRGPQVPAVHVCVPVHGTPRQAESRRSAAVTRPPGVIDASAVKVTTSCDAFRPRAWTAATNGASTFEITTCQRTLAAPVKLSVRSARPALDSVMTTSSSSSASARSAVTITSRRA